MGAGVATSPHLSQVRTAAPVRAWRLSWADRVPAEVLRPRSVPNQIPEGIRSGSPSRRTPTVSLSRPVSPKAPVSAGPSKKVGSARRPHASSSKTLPSASVACVPKDTARFRGGRVSELLSLAGETLLIAKGDNGALIRFAKAESCRFRLWITGISWISAALSRALANRADLDMAAWPSRAFGPEWWGLALPEACLRLQCTRPR